MSFYRRVVTQTGTKVHLSNDIESKWHQFYNEHIGQADELEYWDGTTLCGRQVGAAPLDMQEYDADGNLSAADNRPVDCAHCLVRARLEVLGLCYAIVGEPDDFPFDLHQLFEPWRGVQNRVEAERAAQRPLQEVDR